MKIQEINSPTVGISKQELKEIEKSLIQSLCGSYKVTFKFAETFAPAKDYSYRDRYFSEAQEVAFLLEETEDSLSIQHLLFTPRGIIKHWRQDWVYENRDLFKLVKDHEWVKETISEEQASGTWTQKVSQVDDCPRYDGYGTWVHVDGRHFWESVADAALPRRELSTAQRKDYNILRRHSHIELFEDGWMLEQDNEKIYRDDLNQDTLICLEKGLERFTLASYDTTAVMQWWNDRASFWQDVRNIWNQIREESDRIVVQDDEKLYFAQFALAEKFVGEQYHSEKAVAAIRELLENHVRDFKA